jgi:hypothetical protein
MDSMAHEVAEILLSVGATAFVLLCLFGTNSKRLPSKKGIKG